MSDDLNELTDRLNAVLAEETELLNALDLTAATNLLSRKQDAVAALQGAIIAGVKTGDMGEDQTAALRERAQLLAELGEANRQAIERGLALQTQLIKTIAQAVPKARAAEAPNYQPDGSKVPARPPEFYAFRRQM